MVGELKKVEDGQTHQEEGEVKYSDSATVNGIEMRIDFAQNNFAYEMYFPQIKEGNPIVQLSEDPEIAKRVFQWAREEAKRVKDIGELYSAVEAKAMKDMSEAIGL